MDHVFLQRGVQLHNNARKLPQVRDSSGSSGGGGGSVHHDWKSATVAYLRATAASLVSLGSTSSPKDWCVKKRKIFFIDDALPAPLLLLACETLKYSFRVTCCGTRKKFAYTSD